MKTVKPKQPQAIRPTVQPIEEKEELIGGDNIEQLMQSIIDKKEEIIEKEKPKNLEDVTIEIVLTKKQFERWNYKGGLKWLKKALYKKG